MPKKILSVGMQLPRDLAEVVAFKSDQTLLDADIIIFVPNFSDYNSHATYQGKSLLSESSSFEAVEDVNHWKNELRVAFDAGKTIFVYLPVYEEVYVDTGQRSYSGTGRNRHTTQHVRPINNYAAIPVPLKNLVPKRGTEIRFNSRFSVLSPYWKEFGSSSHYECYFGDGTEKAPLSTVTGNRSVGAWLRGERASGKGNLFLLPMLTLSGKTNADKKNKAHALINALVAIDKAVRLKEEATPAPSWSEHTDFRLASEAKLQQRIAALSEQMRGLAQEREQYQMELKEHENLRRLLYETGKPLEYVVLETLQLMGFTAEPFNNGKSEFDAVFISGEGRFIGEVEGKDAKAVGIDKFRQLESNIQEDFEREEVNEHAKGVLFGNGFRLQPPNERPVQFTEKCLTAAKRTGYALICTSDLFDLARYLKETHDSNFARECRLAILNTKGEIVAFPSTTQMDNT